MDWTHVLAFGLGYATAAVALVCAVALGSAAKEGDRQSEALVEALEAESWQYAEHGRGRWSVN